MLWKNSLLVICKILGHFVYILTADDKHSLLNRDNLTQPIQMQLSPKQKTFPQFFSPVLKCKLNFEHFREKDELQRGCISEITKTKKRG